MPTCVWNGPPRVFERVVFAEFGWKYHNFLKIKTEEWDLKILLFDYWHDLTLGSVETCFLEIDSYVSLERATTGLWEGCFCLILVKILRFFKYKNGGVGPKILLFNYWNDLLLDLEEPFFLVFGASVSLKGATAGVWEGRFCWIDWKYHFLLNIKTVEWHRQTLLFDY